MDKGEKPVNRQETLKINLLGQILLKKGLVSTEQLQEALNVQKKEKGLLGDILINLGYITEEKLSLALASQTDLRYIPVSKYKISREAIKVVPKELATAYGFVPLEKLGQVLTIVMVNPFDREAIKKIEEATQYKIVSMIGAKSQIEDAIKSYYQ